MKKIFTILCCVVAIHHANSQIITSANFPNVGEIWVEFIDTTGSLFNITPAGAAQTWNYTSAFNVGDTSGANFRPLTDAPAYMNALSTFGTADLLVLNVATDSSATFVESNSTGLYYDGFYSQGLFVDTGLGINQNYIDYNPNRLLIPSPISLNGTRTNNARFGLTFNFSGITIDNRSYFIQSFEADASGTLTTPLGTFNNVLRIKEFTYQLDSTSYFPPLVPDTSSVHDTTITYQFVHANSHCLLMTANVDPISLQTTRASYYDPTVLVGEIENETVKVTMYPNPAGETFYLNHIRTNSTIQIFDVSGKLVKDQYLGGLESNIKVNTIEMPSGFYFIKISNPKNGNYFNGKFEVVK